MNETLSNNGDGALEAQADVRPESEVVAAGQAADAGVHALEAEHAALEDPERRCADIKIWVEAECDYFGIEPKNDPVADQITQILFDHEVGQLERGRAEYDVTIDEPRRLNRVIERGFVEVEEVGMVETEAEETATLAGTAAAETEDTGDLKNTDMERAEAETSYRDFLTSDEYRSASNANKIALMTSRPDVPESEQAKWQAFGDIMRIAQAVPEDQAVIVSRLNQLDMSQGAPNPVQFIQSAIFSSADYDSGVSDATQNAIAVEFNLTPRRVVTWSDFSDAMVETKMDADGNEVLVYSDEDPLKFGIGIDGFPSENGSQEFMRATPEHGHTITLDVTKLSPASKGVAASYLGMWKAAEDAGETDFFLDVAQDDIRGQAVLDEASLFRAARIMNYTFGGRAGYNGEISQGNDAVGMIRWQAQLRSPKGDAGRGDNNKSDTRTNLQALAIMDGEGNIDEDVLKAFGDYSRDNWFGAPEYEGLQAHLARLFPEKFDGLDPTA